MRSGGSSTATAVLAAQEAEQLSPLEAAHVRESSQSGRKNAACNTTYTGNFCCNYIRPSNHGRRHMLCLQLHLSDCDCWRLWLLTQTLRLTSWLLVQEKMSAACSQSSAPSKHALQL